MENQFIGIILTEIFHSYIQHYFNDIGCSACKHWRECDNWGLEFVKLHWYKEGIELLIFDLWAISIFTWCSYFQCNLTLSHIEWIWQWNKIRIRLCAGTKGTFLQNYQISTFRRQISAFCPFALFLMPLGSHVFQHML